MPLYERLMGWQDGDVKIPVHQFTATLREFARGRITGAQAQQAMHDASGAALAPAEVAEAQALLATITGSATAKLNRAMEIDDILMLAEGRLVYADPTAVRVRLGV